MMIVRYLYFVGVAVPPAKTHSPLVVDSNAVLAFTAALEFLESVSWRDPKVTDRFSSIDYHQLPVGNALHIDRKTLASQTLEDVLRLSVAK